MEDRSKNENDTKKHDPNFSKENFGVSSERVLMEILSGNGMPCKVTEVDKLITHSIYEMKPSDAVEAKLCAKEASLYTLTMRYLKRAEDGMFGKNNDDPGSRMWYETNMNFALKLLRIHNETVDTLNRYRRRGEQKVVVQHQYVQVNEGGKAVVSNQVSSNREGGSSKIQGGTPCQEKFVERDPEQLAMSLVANQQWPMDAAGFTAERVLAPRQKKAKDEQS